MEKFSPAEHQRPLKDVSNLSILKDISKINENAKAAKIAFNEFYFRFYRYVWNVAYRVCAKFSKDKTLAEDLFQEIFTRAYLKTDLLIKGKVDEVSDITIKAWLGRIGNNILMDYIRTNSIENNQTEFIVEFHEGHDDPGSSEISLDEPNINQIKLEEVIGKLTPKEKDILYLYIYKTEKKVTSEDLKAVAKKHSLSTETIRKTYYRIIESLKKELS
jgi:RNA polymerase sigma factor (sigma-70 family)